MKRIFSIITIFASLVFIIISCSKDPGSSGSGSGSGSGGGGTTTLDCSTVAKSFVTDVNPIIQAVCNTAGCHNNGSTNGPGPLTNYTQVFNARGLIRPAIATGFMPEGTTLSTSQKNSILCWIDNGAANN